MKSQFNRNLQLGYGISIVILLLVGALSYLTLHQLLDSNRSVAHSDEVISGLENTISVMKDAETGQRGYLLTGRKVYLEPYHGAYQKASLLTAHLKQLTGDNRQQQQQLAAIQAILVQRLNILKLLIDKRAQALPVTPSDLDQGKSAMDALRAAIDRAENNERRLLDARLARLSWYTALAPTAIVFSVLLAAAISLFSYFRAIRDVAEKDRLAHELNAREQETAAFNEELTAINEELFEARGDLIRANGSLEQKVAERTRALQESEQETQALNEELAASNEEMQATNEELAESGRRLQELVDELRQADERSAKLAAIVETSDDAIISKSLDGIITSWNRGAERTFGYAESNIVGQSILKLIPEDRQHEEPAIIASIKAGNRVDHYVTKRLTQDGRLIDVSLTISPILDKAGQVNGVSKIARDISEQTQQEQRKSDFIGMASHELKTPLTSLTALIQVLEKKLRDSPDQFIPSALGKANRQTQKMISLINGFLNISRLESGKLVMDKQPVDLNEIIREDIAEMGLVVSSHRFAFETSGPVMVSADHEKIGSVVSNLLSNAVKYSPRGKLVTIRCQIADGEAMVSVQDEGMGVKPEDLPRLFDRYYRASSEHTRHIAGFGIGLYLSAEIIRQHDGRIWAESEKGVGSTFYFTLPYALDQGTLPDVGLNT